MNMLAGALTITIQCVHLGEERVSFKVWVPTRGKWYEQARLSYTLNEKHPGHGPTCDSITCPQIPIPLEARAWCVP